MDSAIGGFQADKEAAFTPKLGEVRPIDIFSHGRRELDEKILNDLEKAVARAGSYLHPPAVRDEGEGRSRLIHGHHRVEAWKRCRGEETPIPAYIFSSATPDALIELLEIEENLLRKELTKEEREAKTIRLAAALKRLDGEKLATELPVLGSDAKSATRGGRGKKAMTARLADQLRLSKPAVQKRINRLRRRSARRSTSIAIRPRSSNARRKSAGTPNRSSSGRSTGSGRRRRWSTTRSSIAGSRRCGRPSVRSIGTRRPRSSFGRAGATAGG